jgi:hypothetical protein
MIHNDLWNEIRESIGKMMIVDTHEHISYPLTNKGKYSIDLTTFLLLGYLRGDFISAGMKPSIIKKLVSRSLNSIFFTEEESIQRWSELKAYIEQVRNTSYYRYLIIALRNLYNFQYDDIDESNWNIISECLREKQTNPLNWLLEVVDRMNLRKVILDIFIEREWPNIEIIKDDRFVHVARMDGLILGKQQTIQHFTKKKIHSMDNYLDLLDQVFQIAMEAGAVGIKSGLAYQRKISFKQIHRSNAERVLLKGLDKADSQEKTIFQDFMMHAVCERCAQNDLPIQIHTGIQAGNWNNIVNAKPTHLTNLFQLYPDVKFDIFHGGYPYVREAGLLAKYFPNVYVDGCWLPHISPTAYRQALDEWLEIVPANKIFAWGGDNILIDHSYASLMLTKDLVTDVLENKVSSGYFNKKTAIITAEKIMGQNASKVYNI